MNKNMHLEHISHKFYRLGLHRIHAILEVFCRNLNIMANYRLFNNTKLIYFLNILIVKIDTKYHNGVVWTKISHNFQYRKKISFGILVLQV